MQIRNQSVSSFIAYIAQFDDRFPQRIAGASEAEIIRLEEIAPRPLPTEYRDFLRHMGNRSDRLVFAGECQTNIFYVSKYYERRMKNGPDPDIPDGCLVVGASCLSSDEMCLDLRQEGKAPVVVMDNGDAVFYAASLIHLLYCRGYTTYRLPVLPQFKFFADAGRPATRESFERAVAWASTPPWSRLWFSDETSLCVEGVGVAFCLTFFDHTGYMLHIGGGKNDNLAETVRTISQIIGIPLTETPLDDAD